MASRPYIHAWAWSKGFASKTGVPVAGAKYEWMETRSMVGEQLTLSIPRNVSEVMRRVHSSDTSPEVSLRKAIWKNGFRYRTCCRDLEGKPDIVFRSRRLAVFVDGDFWHGHQWKRRGHSCLEDQFHHTDSKDYWLGKIRGNMGRDCRVTEALLSKGWSVLRFWESDIQDNLGGCVAVTLAALKGAIDPSKYSILTRRSVAEFFAGIGLMRLALEGEGWSVPFANDIDEKKYEMYGENFPNSESDFLLDDIWKLSAAGIPAVSLATASFPCNDLSLAGACRGLSARQSSAYWRFIAILEELDERKPPLILIENVLGLLRSDQGNDFREALLALNRLGYSVDTFMLDAAAFVPQSRPRLFVVAILSDGEDIEDSFDAIKRETVVRPKTLMKFILSNRDIRWRLRVLPEPEPDSNPLEAILEDLPGDSPFWWNHQRAEYLLNQMSPRHRRIAEQMMAGAEWSFGTVFRRVRKGRSMAELRTDGIAGCLRTPRGGSGRQILFRAGKGSYSVRLLTPRECARLMGADDYKITVPLNQALFGFGDAVCVQVIRWIARYYLNPLVAELLRGGVLRPSDGEARR